MSAERRTEWLNRILLAELGEDPPYQWRNSDALVYWTPVVDDDGRPEHDYLCACGVNKVLHGPSCRFTRAIIRRRFQKVRPDLTDRWVVAVGLPVLEATVLGHRTGRMFVPVTFRRPSGAFGTIAMMSGEGPSEEATWTAVRMIREHRQRGLAEIEAATEDRLGPPDSSSPGRLERQALAGKHDQVKEWLGASSEPGKKREKSFPGIETT